MMELFEYQEFLVSLSATTIFTGLITEAVKKLFESLNWKYQANVIALVVSVLSTVVGGTAWCLMTGQPCDGQYIITIVILMTLTWVSSMLGYDKVIQTLSQIKKG